jgi:hypothetical protein
MNAHGLLLWTLHRRGRSAACILSELAPSDFEVRVYMEGTLVWCHRFETRPLACAWGDTKRQRLEGNGWQVAPTEHRRLGVVH